MPARSVCRPHLSGDNARQPAAAVVCLDGLCAALRAAPPGSAAHPIRQSRLPHDPPEALEGRGAGSHQRTSHQIRHGLRLPLSARLRSRPRRVDQRRGALTKQKTRAITFDPANPPITSASAGTRKGCAPSSPQLKSAAAAVPSQLFHWCEKSRLAREAEQLELALEALESDQAERLATASPAVAAAVETAVEAHKPARRRLPEHLPREDRRHPAPCTCPGCGGALRKIADEVSETLDYVPGRFKSLPSRKRGSSGTFARNYRAGFATPWWRRRRPITRLPAAAPARGSWLISPCQSTTIICRSIVRPRSSLATG